ncbi:MAG: hypothetical protein R6W77_06105 [Trueperaceae bacterium]
MHARLPSSLIATSFVTVLVLLSGAQAQIAPSGQVSIAIGAVAPAGPVAARDAGPFSVASVAFEDVRLEGGTAGFSVGYSGAAQLSLDLSTNRTFGPIGNVVLSAHGAVRSDGVGEADVSVRGVAGPVAMRIDASAYGAQPWRFRPDAVASDARPTWTQSGIGVRLGVTGRLGRTLVLEAEPEAHFTTLGTGWRAAMRLRLLRAWQQNEVRILARGSLSPGTRAAEGAVGVGLVLPRGRAPDLTFAAYLGASAAGVRPGVTVDLAEELGGGTRLALRAAYEPYRLDADALRLATSVTVPMTAFGPVTLPEGAQLEVAAALALPHGGATPRWMAITTFRWPFAGR